MIDNSTLCSLYLEFYMNDEAKMAVANSTGFTIKPHGKDDWFLFTNWHCITGRHQESGISLSKYVDPEIMRVYFHSKNKNWNLDS